MGYGVDCIPDREFCDIKSRRSATSLQKGKTFSIKSKVTTFFSLPLRSIIYNEKIRRFHRPIDLEHNWFRASSRHVE